MIAIRNAREQAGITQEELAGMMGVDRSAVAKWETGVAMPRASLLPKVAKALGCTIDDLYGHLPDTEETARTANV